MLYLDLGDWMTIFEEQRMIRKITMNGVASYKQTTTLETNKRINLIYGLNGSGKSTLSDYLYGYSGINFSSCSLEPKLDENSKIIVYNRRFIEDNFYQDRPLSGIFSLSKANKDIQVKINKANDEIRSLEKKRQSVLENREIVEQNLKKQRQNAVDSTWQIKTQYTGGDRVLAFCLGGEGILGSREKLFDFLSKIDKPEVQPTKTIEQLKNEANILKDAVEHVEDKFAVLSFNAAEIEHDAIFSKIIIGNAKSSISSLIEKLGNQNWVRDGLQFLEKQSPQERRCPFCQSDTINDKFIVELKSFFAEEYESDIEKIKAFECRYRDAIREVNSLEMLLLPFGTFAPLESLKQEFIVAHKRYIEILDANLNVIREKFKEPNKTLSLKDSSGALAELNDIIRKAKFVISDFNKKIDARQSEQKNISRVFWQIQRWEYDQTISLYEKSKNAFDEEYNKHKNTLDNIDTEIKQKRDMIVEEQRKVVNIQQAIDNINANLKAIGIEEFSLSPYDKNLYQIVRGGQTQSVFSTLSEGEKMLISFLYFLELCKGKQTAGEVEKHKIIVIDDPMSSLSHIYIFNISRLIKKEFFDQIDKYEQIFILSHSLYFFHELYKGHPHIKYGDDDVAKCKKQPALYRLIKSVNGSRFCSMSENDIQNDYQAYWTIIRDSDSPNAILANTMRNILEYFFGFIDKCDLNGIFQKPKFADNKYQAFVRFMNAGSHHTSELIYDYSEFDRGTFMEAFRLVFVETDYEEHYNKMMDIRK